VDPEPTPSPELIVEFKTLSEQELVKFLPVEKKDPEHLTPQEKGALDELWRRHYRELKENLRAKTFSLRPHEEPDKEHFLHMCINEAYPAFLRRTRQDEYKNFGGFLFKLALNVGLDVRRQLTKKRADKRSETEKKKKPPVEMISVDDLTETLVDEGKEALQIVAARELREIVRQVLEEHAGESPISALSTRVVRQKYINELSWEQIARNLFPEEDSERATRDIIKAIKTLEEPDIRAILRLLAYRQITNAEAFEV
jgi:hypothetical protein